MKRQKPKIKNHNKRRETLIEFANSMGKLGFSGPRDLSYNLDHYLYGAPKKKLPKDFMKKAK